MDLDAENCEPGLIKEWEDLAQDYKELEVLNREYLAKLDEIGELQAKCVKGISHQKYRMGIIRKMLKRLNTKERREELQKSMTRREQQLYEIEQTLPKPNGTYLQIILGNVNVSILNKSDKFKYKDEYEKFKLVLSVIGFVLSVINLFTNIRTLELSFMFLLVWYYCTLTIRESILKVNGSRIKGWWRFHHFLSTVVSAVLLVWPNTGPWYVFRSQFMWFNVYISIVQYLQFRYQQGVLYRLKALGERDNMDITIEGFHSWMWRGLSFLLPFLFVGYLFQLYNAYTLYELIYHPEATWHVSVLSAMFLVLFLGNITTTIMVIPQKLVKERVKDHLFASKSDRRKERTIPFSLSTFSANFKNKEMPVRINWPLLTATVCPNIGGWVGGYITKKNISWYETLKKSQIIPPNWVFGPVWTTLYCTMGYSSYLVWRDGGGLQEAAVPLSVYGLNLALNWSWSPLFFGTRNVKWALYECVALLGSTAVLGIAFYNINPVAGYLIIPYFVWTSLATTFNYVLYRDNKQLPDAEKTEEKKK